MRGTNQAAVAALMLAAASSAFGSGAVNQGAGLGLGGFRETGPRPFREGRRFDHRGRPVDRNGHRPAGSKLAKKAARGTLTIVGIR